MSAAEGVQYIGVGAFLMQLLAVAVGADRNSAMHVPGPDGLRWFVAVASLVFPGAYPFFAGVGTRCAVGTRGEATKVEAMVGRPVGEGLFEVGVLPTGGG